MQLSCSGQSRWKLKLNFVFMHMEDCVYTYWTMSLFCVSTTNIALQRASSYDIGTAFCSIDSSTYMLLLHIMRTAGEKITKVLNYWKEINPWVIFGYSFRNYVFRVTAIWTNID